MIGELGIQRLAQVWGSSQVEALLRGAANAGT